MKKLILKIIALSLVAVISLCVFASCGSGKEEAQTISGKIWVAEGENISYDFPVKFELFSDGTGSATYDSSLLDPVEIAVNWTAEDGSLMISSILATFTYGYVIEKDSVSLTYNGATVGYVVEA